MQFTSTTQHSMLNKMLSLKVISKCFTLLLFIACLSNWALSQDMPSPPPNNKTLEAGSYVIAMDNQNQANSKNVFNLKAYGLVVYLLNNNVKVKWVIKSGKSKDGIDFTVHATKIKPAAAASGSFDFRAGPFVINTADLNGVSALIDAYNNTIINTSDKVKVYRTDAVVTVDERYDLTAFKPRALLLNNGGNWKIHREFLLNAGINFGINQDETEATNWKLGVAAELRDGCYTFASEAHWSSNKEAEATAVTNEIQKFLNAGGNVLAECAAVRTYENFGKFHSSGGINPSTENKFSGNLSTLIYPNPDLSYSQIQGHIDIAKGGSLKNWTYSGALKNHQHDHVKSTEPIGSIGASVAKLRSSGYGGLMFYLGNHNFDKTDEIEIVNGIRMYLNAFLTPSSNRSAVCISSSSTIGDFVWDDLDQDGIQDVGEPGMPNIEVKLIDAAGNIKAITYTNSQGMFKFDNVDELAGCTNYKLSFSPLPTKYTWSFKNKGTNTNLDSDVNQGTGVTDLFTICPGQSRLDIDAGMFNPGGVLPVNIGQFLGKYESGVSKLNWISFTENNLNIYEVQRSTDGMNFTTIGSVKATGTSSSSTSYNFIDKLPAAGTNYYRLKSIDKNSVFSYSKVVALNVAIKGVNVRSIYPNPFIDKVAVDVTTENKQTVELRLTDNTGRVLNKKILVAQKGTNTFYIENLKSLSGGLYLIEVRAGTEKVIKKLSKQ